MELSLVYLSMKMINELRRDESTNDLLLCLQQQPNAYAIRAESMNQNEFYQRFLHISER